MPNSSIIVFETRFTLDPESQRASLNSTPAMEQGKNQLSKVINLRQYLQRWCQCFSKECLDILLRFSAIFEEHMQWPNFPSMFK
ncbi:hypothetical protein DY000_02014806 [Brassica cretica]|uniref:Uncharacterized protein n=1 Tax=Brassica cretica TaxID=69181 RepID=A0ABQ7D614_BRACR|nr:hypothetical protein DY000_02014806 [Brassica cretica]